MRHAAAMEPVPPVRARALELVAELGPVFRERAPSYDREARFPFENYADLRDAGLLALCIPERYGGMGAGFRDYMHVGAALGRYCPMTALTFNMHTQTVLWTGVIADDLTMTDEERARHETIRAGLYAGIVNEGAIQAQPLSEGIAKGATAGVMTRATPVEGGGFLVSGRKIFASLAGAASAYNLTCIVPGEDRLRFLSVAADNPGVTITGTWDTLGMRGTDSRDLVFDEAFVPAEAELLPPGFFGQIAERWPYVYMTLTPAYVGLTDAVVEFVHDYLSGVAPGGATSRRDSAAKQWGWAEIQIMAERSRATWERTVDEAAADPSTQQLRRALVATYTVMETAQEAAAKAIRVCGGTTIMKRLPLEQHYRDARCGSLMNPWSAEACLERLGRLGLFDD
jgi:alkylation response protein AidB-like acyl-CoA dehydrogenase